MSRVLCSLSLMAVAANSSQVVAQVTFLGPTPYLSTADSPFDMSGLGTTFFLEDFEDGMFDLPPGVTTYPYVVQGPSPTTDSVDADDGFIDGFGTQGSSIKTISGYVNPTNPLTWNLLFDLSFDEQQLGFLPNAFGFVWTDGLPSSRVGVVVLDDNGPAGFFETLPLMDGQNNGETGEDQFIGVTTSWHFTRVVVINTFVSNTFVDQFEIDHVQFGFLVPEPRMGALILVSIAIGAVRRCSAYPPPKAGIRGPRFHDQPGGFGIVSLDAPGLHVREYGP